MTRIRVSTLLFAICALAFVFVGDTTIVAQEANAAPQPNQRVRIVHGTFVPQSLERRELTLALKKLQEQRLALKQEELKVLQAGIRDIKRQISELEAIEQPRATRFLVQGWLLGNNDERAIAVALAKARAHAKRLQFQRGVQRGTYLIGFNEPGDEQDN